jgi:hypothetical protein
MDEAQQHPAPEHDHQEHVQTDGAVPRQPACHPPEDGDHLIELVRKWLDMSELNRRAFLALTQEVNVSAGLVESGVIDLLACFGSLASALTAQRRCVDGMVRSAFPTGSPRGGGRMLADLDSASDQVSRIVDRLVVCIQFQDRTNQHLQQVSDTLSLLGNAAAALQAETQDRVAGLAWQGGPDEAWQQRIVAGQTLAAVRARFVKGLLAPAPEIASQQPHEGEMCVEGSVDLF